MASLVFLSGASPGRHYPLGKRTTVVGRDESVPLQVNDERISRRHFQIRHDAEAGCYCLLDMKSTHGTYVNGRMVDADTVLSEGDEIRAGDAAFLFTLLDFEDAAAALSHWKQVGQRGKTTMPE